MTKRKYMRLSAGTIILLLLLHQPSWIEGAENSPIEHMNQILDSAALPQAGKATVKARAGAAIQAGVPVEDVDIIVSRAVGRGADHVVINRFLDVSASAKQKGLPLTPLLNRMEQGLSKGVPLERIATASERLAEKLAEAQPFVDALIRDGIKPQHSSDREEAIGATARALEQSISAEAMKGMGEAVKDRRGSLPLFTSAADTASYFLGRGMSPKTALHLVQQAVEKGYSEHDLDGMVRQMDAEMRRGVGAEEAAKKMEREGMQRERGMDRNDMRQDRNNDHGRGAGSGMGGRGR